MVINGISDRPIAVCGIVLGIAAVSAVGSDDPALTVACGVVTALTIGLLWRLGEAPALLMAAGLQLSQVITPLLYANLRGMPLQGVSFRSADVTSATWFALAAILSLVVGLWCGQLGKQPRAASTLWLEAKSWSPQSAFVFCIVTVLFAAVFEVLSGLFEGLRQAFLAAAGVQWLGVFVLASACTAQRSGFGYLLLVICLEVVKGFTGYFGEFQMVLFVLLVGIFSVRPKLKLGTICAGLVVASIVLTLGAFWSAVKVNYRSYVGQGPQSQAVVVPVGDRLGYLVERLLEVDWNTMSTGFDQLAKRWGYVDFLAATMRNVPARLPHQNGAQIGDAVMHVLQPRLFFPDKPPLLSDNQLAAKYAGFRLDASTSAGTSFSLGYVAELYIDFGILGTIGGMFVLGLLGGRAFRFVSSSPSLRMFVNSGLAVMLATTATRFEISLPKIVGAFLMTLIVILIFRRFLLPSLLDLFGPNNRPKFRHRIAG